jgi:hypothetical protein
VLTSCLCSSPDCGSQAANNDLRLAVLRHLIGHHSDEAFRRARRNTGNAPASQHGHCHSLYCCGVCAARDGRSLVDLPRAEDVLVLVHQDPGTAKAHTFHLQPQTLLVRTVLTAFDLTARPDYPLPRQRVAGFSEHLHHLSVIERIPRGRGDLSIRRHFAFWDLPHGAPDRRFSVVADGGAQRTARDLSRVRLPPHRDYRRT